MKYATVATRVVTGCNLKIKVSNETEAQHECYNARLKSMAKLEWLHNRTLARWNNLLKKKRNSKNLKAFYCKAATHLYLENLLITQQGQFGKSGCLVNSSTLTHSNVGQQVPGLQIAHESTPLICFLSFWLLNLRPAVKIWSSRTVTISKESPFSVWDILVTVSGKLN